MLVNLVKSFWVFRLADPIFLLATLLCFCFVLFCFSYTNIFCFVFFLPLCTHLLNVLGLPISLYLSVVCWDCVGSEKGLPFPFLPILHSRPLSPVSASAQNHPFMPLTGYISSPVLSSSLEESISCLPDTAIQIFRSTSKSVRPKVHSIALLPSSCVSFLNGR